MKKKSKLGTLVCVLHVQQVLEQKNTVYTKFKFLERKGAVIRHVGREVFTGIHNPNHSIILQFKILKPLGTFSKCLSFLSLQAKQSIMHIKKSTIYFLSVYILVGKVLLIIIQL
jgi:hypothetical protein